MEILYHCSPVSGLTELQPNVTKYFGKPRQVCLAASLPMALMYGVKHFEYTYGYIRGENIYFEEYYPDALEEIYRGKSASLYLCEKRDDMETTRIPNEYVTANPVPVVEEIFLPDVCEALLEQERLGALRIIHYPEMQEHRRTWILEAEANVVLEKNLLDEDSEFSRYIREKYPESWELAQRRKKEQAL